MRAHARSAPDASRASASARVTCPRHVRDLLLSRPLFPSALPFRSRFPPALAPGHPLGHPLLPCPALARCRRRVTAARTIFASSFLGALTPRPALCAAPSAAASSAANGGKSRLRCSGLTPLRRGAGGSQPLSYRRTRAHARQYIFRTNGECPAAPPGAILNASTRSKVRHPSL